MVTKAIVLILLLGREDIKGTLTYIWNRQEAPDDNYNEKRWLAKEAAYLKLYKIWSNEGMDPSVIFTPPLTVGKLNPAVGDTWVFEENFEDLTVKSTSYVESTTDIVTVAAGTFNNCIIVRELNEITESGVTEYEHEKKWYAPDVGLIIHRDYNENWDSVTFSQELVNFSLMTILYVSHDGVCNSHKPCFSLIQAAIDAADSATLIKVAEGIYEEDLVIDQPRNLSIQRGWDSTFTSQSGTTNINFMTLSDGMVVLDEGCFAIGE